MVLKNKNIIKKKLIIMKKVKTIINLTILEKTIHILIVN